MDLRSTAGNCAWVRTPQLALLTAGLSGAQPVFRWRHPGSCFARFACGSGSLKQARRGSPVGASPGRCLCVFARSCTRCSRLRWWRQRRRQTHARLKFVWRRAFQLWDCGCSGGMVHFEVASGDCLESCVWLFVRGGCAGEGIVLAALRPAENIDIGLWGSHRLPHAGRDWPAQS